MHKKIVRVDIDQNECTGSTLCQGEFPEAFLEEPNGQTLKVRDLTESEMEAGREKLIMAARSCPVEAITITYSDGTISHGYEPLEVSLGVKHLEAKIQLPASWLEKLRRSLLG